MGKNTVRVYDTISKKYVDVEVSEDRKLIEMNLSISLDTFTSKFFD